MELPKARGFTLVELLVVIAVITILAAMLLPTLEASLDQSRLISCMNNQKQMYLGTGMYCQDNSDFFPEYSASWWAAPTSLSAYYNATRGTQYCQMGSVINGSYTAREVMLDPGASYPSTQAQTSLTQRGTYAGFIGWGGITPYPPVKNRCYSSVSGWYAQYFFDFAGKASTKEYRRWGVTPRIPNNPAVRATTAMVMCYQENLLITNGAGSIVAGENGAHQRKKLNVLYEDGHTRCLSSYHARMLSLTNAVYTGGYWRTTSETIASGSCWWLWAMNEDRK